MVIATRWVRSALVAATTLVVVPRYVPAQAAPAETAQGDLQQQQITLNEPAASQVQRDEAARRLVSRSSKEANQILFGVLTDLRNRAGQLAVARALASETAPDPSFVDPLSNLLGADARLTEAAAQALASYKSDDRVLDRLAQFANNLSQAKESRAFVARAMGRLVDRRAAGQLINLLTDLNSLVRDAAIDGLLDMTNRTDLGRDPQRWQTWWKDTRSQSDLEWTRDLLNKVATRAGEQDDRLSRFRTGAEPFYREEYRARAEGDRPKLLETYLHNDSEDIRLIAVQIVNDEVVNGSRLAPEVFASLRGMVGDSSADVRERVARTLSTAADPAAVDALLVQLGQERNADVRGTIAQALGRMNDLRAVEPLLAHLDDESFTVVKASSDALGALCPKLRDPRNAALAAQVAQKLHLRLRGTDETRMQMASLRQSIVETMARLGHPSSLRPFSALLTERESVDVRRAALAGLGAIGNPDSANEIAAALDDPVARIRLAAVEALRTTGTFVNARKLAERLDSSREPQPEISKRAWEVLAGDDKNPGLLAGGSISELQGWAQKFDKDNDEDRGRRLVVLQEIEKKQAAAKDAPALAATRQNLGQTFLALGKADEAAPKFRQALDYWHSVNAEQAVTDLLTQQLFEALLRSRKYDDAVLFGTRVIQESQKKYMSLIWQKISAEATRLQKGNELDSALAMIEAMKKLPLDPPYSGLLNDLDETFKQQRTTGGAIWIRQYTGLEHVTLPGLPLS